VSHDELRARLWSADTFVDFDRNLITAVKKLRDALGDSAEQPRFIQTVPRRGYSFIAPVETGPAESASGAVDSRTRAAGRTRWLAAAAALALLATAAGYAWQAVRARAADAAMCESRITVAVLPFQHAGQREQHSFSVLLKDEIVQQLANAPRGNVAVVTGRAVQKYDCDNSSVREIGRELGVSYVVEGHVSRAGKMLRISANLTSTTDQTLVLVKSVEVPVEEAAGSGTRIGQELGRVLLACLSPPAPQSGGQISMLSKDP
jgi:TolB-like protein